MLQTFLLSGLFSRLCWRNYLDSQRFYSISWFWSDQQDQQVVFAASVSLSDHSNVLSYSGLLCQLLIWSKAEYRPFLAPPMNYNMVNRFDHYAFSYNLWNLQVIAFQVVQKMNLDSLLNFPAAIVYLRLLKPTYLVSDLGSGFRYQTTQNPIHHLS